MTKSNSKSSDSRGDRRKSSSRRRTEPKTVRPASDKPASDRPSAADDSFTYDDDDGPMSLAEELVDEAERGVKDETNDRYEKIKQGEIHIAELQKLGMSELIEEARKENVTDVAGMKKQDLIFRILKERVKMNGLMYGEGTLEILPDGFGFLRSPDYHYLSCPDDIYVSPSQIRRFGLQTGSTVSGQAV